MDKGAHYFKCDFQVHTPRDRQWTGPDCVSDAERKAFAEQMVAACRTKGLQAIAIADHHDLAFYNHVRDAARSETDPLGLPLSEEERLVVYPGVELTLGIPCQALLLFDAEFPEEHLATVLTALSITPAPANQAKASPVEKLANFPSFADVYARLNEFPHFRGRFIILPHVQEKGHQTLLRKGFDAHYKAMPCVGGYTDGPISKLGEGNKRIIAGEDANYGNKKIAVIQTSDSRSIGFEQLGAYPTWIKWAVPSAEALRQACLSEKSRISIVEPIYPKARILSISVSDSVFLGNLAIELNSQYNAFIGGRGTGKSSLLEYIRWGLCDQPVAVSEEQIGDIPNYAAKRELLIEGTLRAKGAVVIVECDLNGVRHLVRRNAATNQVEIKVGEEDWTPSTEQEIRDKFPIQAYSQKQLSSVGVIPVEIERLVTAEISAEVATIATDVKLLADSIRQLSTQQQSINTLAAEIARESSQLASEKAQIEALRKQLKGLSPEDQAILSQASIYSKQQAALDGLARLLSDYKSRLDGYVAEIDGYAGKLPDLSGMPDRGSLEIIAKGISGEFAAFKKALSEAQVRVADASELRQVIRKAEEAVGKAQKDFGAKYTAAKARSTSHQSSLTELARLEASTQVIEKGIESKQEQIQKLGDPSARLAATWTQWIDLHRKRAELVKTQCERLQLLSGGAFRARAKACGNDTPIIAALTTCFANKNIRKAEEKIESIAKEIVSSADPIAEWFKLASELQSLLNLREQKTLADTPILEKALLSRANRESLQEGLSPEAILELRLTVLEDLPEFEFRIGPDKYIAFAEASSGQQATSLLKVLLNQDGPPLLIDQPEEDLDNEIIQEIASAIWETKSKRQLVFVSHNANIVVNGDAELVVCFDYITPSEPNRGHIKCQGAIDVPEVKESIKRVMEGGDRAFELRRQKYGF